MSVTEVITTYRPEPSVGPTVAKPTLDVAEIRKDFPILTREIRGKPLVYLDNAATSQKPRCVIDALKQYYEQYNANVHRAIHALGEKATREYERAREKVARFINADGPECIVFTKSATEAINLVRFAWGRKFIREGDEILLTEMEHHSNLIPWQLLAQEQGASLRFIAFHQDGTLRLEELGSLLRERTKLVAITHMSNVFGTINPVSFIAEVAHRKGAVVLVDGAQSVPHLPVDVQKLGCDFLAFSGHKMLGPTGVGVLYAKKHWLEAMNPFLGGGEMISEVWLDHATWNEVPYKFEAGTPCISEAIGLGVAVDYLKSIGAERVRQHEMELTQYALERMTDLGFVTIYGQAPVENRGGVIAFNVEGIHPHDLAQFLDQDGIAVRAGHHCAQPLMKRLGIPAAARASFYLYNTPEEVDVLIRSLEKAKTFFNDVSQ